MPISGTYVPGAHRIARLQIACTRLRPLAVAILITLLTPITASAACVFTEAATAHGVTGVPEDSALSSLWPQMDTLGGIRPPLARKGISISPTYIGEVLGNPSGGVKQGIWMPTWRG